MRKQKDEIEYHQLSETFSDKVFLNQCESALLKCGLIYEKNNFKEEWWSGKFSDDGFSSYGNKHYDENLTVYEGLKKYGYYNYNSHPVAISFQKGLFVYCAVKK